MSEKTILTGNEAIARGFYEASGKVASSYPGSPTVEILENIKKYDDIYTEFSINEKVALEVGIGSSIAGVRSLVSMKHVGVNICMDPLMTFVQTKTNGGFLLVTGDDPGLFSSQNEQDNRVLGKFANMAILDPSNSQDAKDFVVEALNISEIYNIPMMLRITSRLCHSRGVVELNDKLDINSLEYTRDIPRYCMLPPYANRAQLDMRERLEKLEEYAYNTPLNKLEEVENSNTLIITSGLMYEHLKEINPNVSIYKLGLVYPISINKIKELASEYENIIILEEMMPFIENELKVNNIKCEGKKYFSFTGELQIEDIEKGLINANVLKNEEIITTTKEDLEVVARGPMFCSGCPHRPVFDILKKSKALVVGDIGCYSMSILYPFEVSQINISMGASLGIIKGMSKANKLEKREKPLVAVIGDGTFFHSGISGAINLLHQIDKDENITILVLDNGATAMTGGQANASSGKYQEFGDMDVSIDDLIKTIGFEDIQRVDQFDYSTTKKVINDAIKRPGISFVITSRPCALKFKIKEPHYYVEPNTCIGCRSCVKTNCPPIRMKEYEDKPKLKSSIDSTMCVGCSVCAQVCPVNAIHCSKSK
ncbi:MAG: thiamine pyrophosphate-dependent enzyme [Peptostreptococcaceae bacterium]